MGRFSAVNVRDFGAVGDGVTDDTTAVLAAVATGNTVYFPAINGITNYLLTRSITLSSGQGLEGDGFRLSRLLWNTSLAAGGALLPNTYNMLRGLSFYGPDQAGKHGLYTASSTPSRLRVYDCNFADWDDGVHLSGNCCFDFFGCYALSNVNGVNLGETVTTNAMTWHGGEIAQNTNAGILIAGAANRILFSGVTIEANTNYGFTSSGAGYRRGIALRDCWFETHGTAHVHNSATAMNGLIIDTCHFSDGTTPKDVSIDGGYFTKLRNNYHNPTTASRVWIEITANAYYTDVDVPMTQLDSSESWPTEISDAGWFTRYGFPMGMRALTADSATPFVWQSSAGRTQNVNPTSYTNFVAGRVGQTFALYVDDANTTIDHDNNGDGSGPILLASGADETASAGDVFFFLLCDDGAWREITPTATT